MVTDRVRRSVPSAAMGVAGARGTGRVVVDRASPADRMQLAADVGPAPMHVGAVLVLGAGPGFSVGQARRPVLAELVDESSGLPLAGTAAVPFPAPAPGPGTLAAEAWVGRARRLAHPAGSIRTIGQGLAELGGARPPRRLPRTSLNRPTGPRRRLDVITADLAAVRGLGHACGGTVNDVILAAVTGALRALLAGRGEQIDSVTISVPVSARRHATSGQLGNQVGVMSVALPAAGSLAGRITRIAAITGQRKTAAKGTSAALIGPLFRLLARTGLLRRFVNRQRLVHTFATNLRGPEQPLSFAGAPVRAVIPVAITAGNVPVTFAALSYAGTVWLTVLSDPDQAPDVGTLTAALRQELPGTPG